MIGPVKPQIHGIAGPVADLSAENAGPNRQIFFDVNGTYDHVRQTSDTCIPAGEVTPTRVQRPDDQLDTVAAEVREPKHLLDLAQRAVVYRPAAGGDSKSEQSFKSGVEIFGMAHLQTNALHGMVSGRERKRVVSKIGSKGRQLLSPVDRLQPENALREVR